MALPRLPRIVNAQRMGARLHLCVEDLGNAGAAGQRCACGQVVVQSDEVLLGHWSEADHQDPDWWCRRCWAAYQKLKPS